MKRSSLVKQLISNYLTDYENQLEKGDTSGNGSFVMLDHQTLQMILTFLFAQLDQEEKQSVETVDIEANIDQLIKEQSEQYEKIIRKLEEKV
jgi:DNA-binding ferritin-like protein (Dps family)